MISTVKIKKPSPKNIRIYSVENRLKLAEAVIIKAFSNAEGFPTHKDTELKELESVQLYISTSLPLNVQTRHRPMEVRMVDDESQNNVL